MRARRIAILLMCLASVVSVSASAQKLDYPATKPGDAGYAPEDPRIATRLLGKPGPAIKLVNLSGGTIDLAKFYGRKPVYFKLWATYCLACRAQTPGFEKLYETYGDRIQVVAINAGIGDDIAKVRSFVTGTKMKMPVAIDDGSLGAWLKMEGTPIHVVIGRDGRIVYAGHQDGPALQAALDRVLMVTSKPIPIPAAKVVSLPGLKLGHLVRSVELRGPDDNPVQLVDGATGKPRAILFTATWCEDYLKDTEPQTVEACRRTRQLFDELSHDKAIDAMGIVTHLWTTPKALTAYLTRMKTPLPMAVDVNGEAFREFGISRFASIALISADGHLIRLIDPGDTDVRGAVTKLESKR